MLFCLFLIYKVLPVISQFGSLFPQVSFLQLGDLSGDIYHDIMPYLEEFVNVSSILLHGPPAFGAQSYSDSNCLLF